MARANLARIDVAVGIGREIWDRVGCVMLGHVGLKFLGVGSWWWLPAGLLEVIIEIVGQIL